MENDKEKKLDTFMIKDDKGNKNINIISFAIDPAKKDLDCSCRIVVEKIKNLDGKEVIAIQKFPPNKEKLIKRLRLLYKKNLIKIPNLKGILKELQSFPESEHKDDWERKKTI